MKSKKWRILELLLIICLIGTLFLPWLGNRNEEDGYYCVVTAPLSLKVTIETVVNLPDTANEIVRICAFAILLSIGTMLFFAIAVCLILSGVFTCLSGKNGKYKFRRIAWMKWSKILIALQVVNSIVMAIVYIPIGKWFGLKWQLLIPCVLMTVEHFVHKKLSDEELNDQWRATQIRKESDQGTIL